VVFSGLTIVEKSGLFEAIWPQIKLHLTSSTWNHISEHGRSCEKTKVL